jgi:NADPH:quinone reductase-like Zn-dependent oxidoreductase
MPSTGKVAITRKTPLTAARLCFHAGYTGWNKAHRVDIGLGRVPEGEWRAKVSAHRASSPWAHAFKQAEGATTMDSSDNRVLVTGVPGRVRGVGSAIVEILRRRNLPVRALVLREDQHTDALRANGVDVVVGDLARARDVAALYRVVGACTLV